MPARSRATDLALPCRAWPPLEGNVCGLHEQCPHVFVAALGYLAEDGAVAAVDSCFGMSPSQAAKPRPCLKPAPLPIAATTAQSTLRGVEAERVDCGKAVTRRQFNDPLAMHQNEGVR